MSDAVSGARERCDTECYVKIPFFKKKILFHFTFLYIHELHPKRRYVNKRMDYLLTRYAPITKNRPIAGKYYKIELCACILYKNVYFMYN